MAILFFLCFFRFGVAIRTAGMKRFLPFAKENNIRELNTFKIVIHLSVTRRGRGITQLAKMSIDHRVDGTHS